MIMKLFSFHSYSFATKVIIAFLIFIVFFIFVRFILSIPRVEQQALKNELENITHSLRMIKDQISVMGKAITMQRELEVNFIKKEIENQLLTLDLKSKEFTSYELIEKIKQSPLSQYCSVSFNEAKSKKANTKQWIEHEINTSSKNYQKRGPLFYTYPFEVFGTSVTLSCEIKELNPNHMKFEKSIKEHLSTGVLIDSNLSSTKMALTWINSQANKEDESIFYEKDKEKRKAKYQLSKLSNVDNIPTGNLSLKKILELKEQESPFLHAIEDKEVFTWIIDLNLNSQKQTPFLLIYSINKEELVLKNKVKIFFLLPETLLAIGISFILIFFIFRRILKNINTLTKTALLVNQGERNIRSQVKGEDDIGILGKSFDSMLDFFENSIKTLDQKVEEKTKEISKSLEEKEILLKEIHHRVKNNLALTISLLELQEEEIEDKKTKKILVDIQERIYTMELLHRKLYESANLNKIDFKNYVIELIHTIAKTYDKKNKVALLFEIDEIDLNIETAMPYGLILNELVTNSFKYAFTHHKNPELCIGITQQNDNEILLIIKDNGKGLKKEFEEISQETLGLRLISIIVKLQLMGRVSYSYENGAKFTILGNIKQDMTL